MQTVTATNVKNHFGRYLETAIAEPVVIRKTGRAVAVILSIRDYERLAALEDQYWAQRATEAEQRGYIGKQAAVKFLKSR